MKVSYLNKFVDHKNSFADFFKQPHLSIQNAQDRQRIANMIDGALSPENLTCDGELSRTEVQRRYRELTGAAKELLALDPSVKFYEYE
jgi:hypothetical protein